MLVKGIFLRTVTCCNSVVSPDNSKNYVYFVFWKACLVKCNMSECQWWGITFTWIMISHLFFSFISYCSLLSIKTSSTISCINTLLNLWSLLFFEVLYYNFVFLWISTFFLLIWQTTWIWLLLLLCQHFLAKLKLPISIWKGWIWF